MYYTKKVVRKFTSIDRQKWYLSIQILTKCTSRDRQNRFVYYNIDKMYSNIYTRFKSIYIYIKKTKKNHTNRLTSVLLYFYWWHAFFSRPAVGRLLQKRLIWVILFLGGVISRGEVFDSSVFWGGILFSRVLFHCQLSCCVRDCQRRRHGLIWEGEFLKRASKPVAVVPGALVPGTFGSGWDFWTVQIRGNYTTCMQICLYIV